MRKLCRLLSRVFSKDFKYYLAYYVLVRPLRYTTFLSDKFIVSIMFRIQLGYKLNLENPKTFNEKLQWLKLNDRNPLYPQLVDKVLAKEYVAALTNGKYIIPTYQKVTHARDIKYESLPNQFVVKANHDSGSVYVVKDKNLIDKQQIERLFSKSLKRNYYYEGREWAYKKVKPQILIEEYLENSNGEPLLDYKFFCFHGEPRFLYVSQDLHEHNNVKMAYLSSDFGETDIHFDDYPSFSPQKPEKFEEMKQLCRTLSSGLKFARIDLYCINNQIFFSEITLYPASGFRRYPYDVDLRIGKMLNIE